jgi:hypothetical protein
LSKIGTRVVVGVRKKFVVNEKKNIVYVPKVMFMYGNVLMTFVGVEIGDFQRP